MHRGWKGQEVWRFIKDDTSGHVVIASWTHAHKVLCSDENGRVCITNLKNCGGLEKWKITKLPRSRGISIQSVEHGRYLAFNAHGIFTMDLLNNESDERLLSENDRSWNLGPAHQNRFFITSKGNGKRLSCTNDQPSINGDDKKKWIIKCDNGLYTICSEENGKYLSSADDGDLIMSESENSWAICISTHGDVFIQYDGRKVSCDDSIVIICTPQKKATVKAIRLGTLNRSCRMQYMVDRFGALRV